MWLRVNKAMLPMKGHYFLYNAGTAPVQSFMSIYVKSLGFSTFAYGTISSILPVFGMLSKPIFGAIADRYILHKFFFLLFQLVTIVAFFSIQFIPKTNDGAAVKMVCESEMNFHVRVDDSPDKCNIERALSVVDSNETVKCVLTCDLTPQFANEVCYHWKARLPACPGNESSGGGNSRNGLSAERADKKSAAADVGKNAYAEKFARSVANVKTIAFNATVAMKHTLQVADELYFRVSKVVLESDPATHVPYCLQLVEANCTARCESSPLAQILETRDDSKEDYAALYQFWLLLFLLILSWVGMAVVSSISDAICFEMLGAKASQYGNQRLWGSVGWGSFAFLSGVIIDAYSRWKNLPQTDYTPMFYIMLFMLLCDIACSYSLKYQQTKLSTQILRNVGKLLSNVKVDLFFVWCIFIGICAGVQWNFLFWYIDEMSTSRDCTSESWAKTLQGLLSAVQCFLGELPSFFFSGWLFKKFGHVNVMSGILLLVGVRFLLYSFLTNPWWCLPIEILQSTMGLSFATMASYASIVAPPGTEATVQGLVGAIFEGIGVSLGSFLGGLFYRNYGGGVCFRIIGIASLIAFAIHATAQYLLARSTAFTLEGKDFNGVAKYASPNEAVSMLETHENYADIKKFSFGGRSNQSN